MSRALGSSSIWFVLGLGSLGLSLAVPPGEVGNLRWSSKTTLLWNATPGASDYNVYRGSAAALSQGEPPRCHGDEIASTSLVTASLPAAGQAYVYLATAENAAAEEGTPGNRSNGVRRDTLGRCDAVMRHHVLDRITFGWNDYVRDRINTLGVTGFINQQLSPSSIDESSNSELQNRLDALPDPASAQDLERRQMTFAVYARRQLQHVIGMFWSNHFNTDYNQTSDFFFNFQNAERSTAQVIRKEFELFRDLAFTGTFRELVEASAYSPAMISYLDTTENTKDRPNENYGRELMELHTMGVDGGYTQQDVREMARVWSGWTVCRKLVSDVGDPLASCRDPNNTTYLWSAHFSAVDHDCGAKLLFAGTPQQVNIPATCNGSGISTNAGINDATLALDAVADHPSTKRFISKKLLHKFVSDTPNEAMIQDLITTWNATGGDLLQLLTKALGPTLMRQPDVVSMKLKTPLEQIAGNYRAMRGGINNENWGAISYWLTALQMPLHQNPTPTGYAETGQPWINTGGLLSRQNVGYEFAAYYDYYKTNVIGVLAAGGLSPASPAGSIIDYFSDILLGGQLAPRDRQLALDFMATNDNGTPSPHDADRVRQVFALLLGFSAGLEQ